VDREEKVLKALANKKRLEVLRLLKSSSDGINIGELAKKIRLSERSTSKHLFKLNEAGLVKKNRIGMFMISRVPKEVWQILELLNKMFYRKK